MAVLAVLTLSLIAYPSIILDVIYDVSSLLSINYNIFNTLEGFFTAGFILNANNTPSSEEDEIEHVD